MSVAIARLVDADVVRVCEVLPLSRLYQGDGTYLVAWDADEPVGHLHLAYTSPPELQDLTVREGYRRRGVATSLIAAAEEECRRLRCTQVRVTVSVDNDVARALYESLGYVDTGIPARRVRGTVELRTGPLEVDDTLYVFEKPLAAPA